MSRTLIWNTSASAQTLPAGYGGGTIQPGFGWVVSDESSVAVAALGGFEAMHGKWAVAAISTDEALGSVDVGAGGVALIENVVSLIAGSGGGGGGGVSSWNDLTDKPTFATVATSGSYADLTNKPSLAAVAASGAYADLTGKPSIPVASNTAPEAVGASGAAGVLNTYARGDHAHAHGNQAGGSLHSVATSMAAGFMSAADKGKLDGLAAVATSGAYADLSGTPTLATVAESGAYADLSGKPSLFSGAYADLTGKPSLFSGSYNDLTSKPTLAAVATSGAYADLTGKPTLANVATTGSYQDLADKPSLFSGSYTDLTNKPTLFSGAYADLTGKPSLAAVATSGAYADLSGKPVLAAVATSGLASDVANLPYDIAVNSPGTQAAGAVLMRMLAPRDLVLQSLAQGGDAVVKITVNGNDAVYPQAVAQGDLLRAVVTTGGAENYFTLTAKVA